MFWLKVFFFLDYKKQSKNNVQRVKWELLNFAGQCSLRRSSIFWENNFAYNSNIDLWLNGHVSGFLCQKYSVLLGLLSLAYTNTAGFKKL